ncbi:AzlD domain-containing protein [Vibrio quintilis]|uniref:Branched-chain amino acid transport protein (AzlD) n=1 Tax=Vibrio quintilis TaxID=1117707 RepID=A0A1M7YWW0_9VIBR|nr:AzlD domain-containing protein [Vibrio quintilis]SHO57072.1 Branched-chain amino acid transport protein (AzlD) [Vibrio quintilis]
MIMAEIIILAGVVFFSRYFFLAPGVPFRPGAGLQRFLSYSGPAVLTVIWAPIVFMPDQKLWMNWHNPYLWSALLAGLIAWKTKNVLFTTISSMTVFLVLHLWVLPDV